MPKYEWNNVWMHQRDEWHPMRATTEEESLRELTERMPYTEEGTRVRIDGKEIVLFVPPRNPPINFGPF